MFTILILHTPILYWHNITILPNPTTNMTDHFLNFCEDEMHRQLHICNQACTWLLSTTKLVCNCLCIAIASSEMICVIYIYIYIRNIP